MATTSLRRLAVCGLVALAACTDTSSPVVAPQPDTSEKTRFQLTCTADIRASRVTCGAPGSVAGRSDVILGGQGTYVQLTSSNIQVVADTFAFDVTVQNLIPQALATVDGTTLDPAGVRVFFEAPLVVTAGTGTIEVANADGTGTFTASNQEFYQYDELLPQNAVSTAKQWRFRFDPTVDSFTFGLFVSAAVQFPDGWIDLSTDTATFLLEAATLPVTPVVRTVVGKLDSAAVVTWTSSDTTVATVDGAGTVAAVAPGNAIITATAGTRTSSFDVSVCPDLAVGETYVATMPGAANTCFGGQGSVTEYTYIPMNLSTSSALSLTVTGSGIQAVTGPPSPNVIAEQGGLRLASHTTGESSAARIARLEADRRATRSLVGKRESRIAPTGGARRAITPGVPAVGDLWTLNVAQGCSGTLDNRVGRVRTVGTNVIIVGDTANPAGGFTTAQYDSIALEFDSIAYPVVTSNFGASTDVDGNGRIVLFFTRAVNELSPPASSSLTYGYFTNRDVFTTDPVDGCERSNAGEILYMLVPDPTGAVNSNVRTVSQVRGNVIRQAGMELQSLVNAFRRAYVTGATSFEEPWLDEGLSRIASELMFYRTSVGLAPGQNIVVTNLTTGPNASRRVAAFNTYANSGLGEMRSWLQRPDTTAALKGTTTLASMGATWGFLRYAADRVGGTQPSFWSSLVDSNLTGKANIANAIDADADEWLRDFTMGMYADDAVAGIDTRYMNPSWNYRSLYGALNGSYQLAPRPLTNNTPLTLSYSRGGGSAFARFGVPASSFASVTALSGGVAPTSPFTLIVMRTK